MESSNSERFSHNEGASLTTYLGVLRRRAWIIVLCLVVAPVVAYKLSERQATVYTSSADVYVNQQNIATALTGISGYNSASAALAVNTQASLAAVPSVAARALALSKLRDRSAGTVLGETSIIPDPTTNILRFTVVDPSPADAALLATSYARAFTVYSNRLASQPITKALGELQTALNNLAAEKRKGSALYANLLEKAQQLQTLQTLQTSGTVLIRRAAGAGAIGPHPKRDAALGLILGLVLGLGLAFGLEALDTRIRSTGELSEGLGGLPLLGRIPPPAAKLQKRNELTSVVEPNHSAAEAFRLFRTNLEFVRLSAGEIRTILVTSAVEKEGKSTTAANLAVAEARSGRRVALVDLDLRRPHLDRLFHLTAYEGITDVAIGRIDLAQALQPIDLRLGIPESDAADLSSTGSSRPPVTHVGELHVLPSGQLPPDPGEFAASYRLAEILSELQRSYDTVIIDTPPLLRVGDALTLSSQADGLIVVARLKGLRKQVLRELGRILEVVPARRLGFVVTGPLSGEGGAYGMSDAYGYAYGSIGRAAGRGRETEKSKARK